METRMRLSVMCGMNITLKHILHQNYRIFHLLNFQTEINSLFVLCNFIRKDT